MPNHYYVATNGVDALGGGAAGSPWRTIGYAAQQLSLAADGAIVHVASGVYAAVGAISRNGSSTQWIRYVSDVKWGAIVDGQNSDALLWQLFGNWSTVEGFVFRNTASALGNCALATYGLH